MYKLVSFDSCIIPDPFIFVNTFLKYFSNKFSLYIILLFKLLIYSNFPFFSDNLFFFNIQTPFKITQNSFSGTPRYIFLLPFFYVTLHKAESQDSQTSCTSQDSPFPPRRLIPEFYLMRSLGHFYGQEGIKGCLRPGFFPIYTDTPGRI